MIVHFPLALCLTAVLALWLARLLPAGRTVAQLSRLGTWNLLAGALAAIFALGSGLVALSALPLGAGARGAVALTVTGFHGGENVYLHGIGVAVEAQ